MRTAALVRSASGEAPSLLQMGTLDTAPHFIPSPDHRSATNNSGSQQPPRLVTQGLTAESRECSMLRRIVVGDVLEVCEWHRHLRRGALVRVQALCEPWEALKVTSLAHADTHEVYYVSAGKLKYRGEDEAGAMTPSAVILEASNSSQEGVSKNRNMAQDDEVLTL
eukprot:TRINITY_DN16150_c0_g1_i5.p1 TRINITY_DN16150_c0_g1~~TRINITY_DN16150_c0_g1_i5.p1  ORF type:complete len:166 (+),score=37.57 TRINITY_DN16150_c0_g1_i5:122-619(+)